jgi:hypothetical protein
VSALVDAVRARFAGQVHHVLATVRVDGAPRLCGTEVRWWGSDLFLASMADSWKSRDLFRDGRLLLHSGTVDPPAWSSDARIGGRALAVPDSATKDGYAVALEQAPPGPFDLFRVEVTELVLVALAPSQEDLVVTSWQPGSGVRVVQRR